LTDLQHYQVESRVTPRIFLVSLFFGGKNRYQLQLSPLSLLSPLQKSAEEPCGDISVLPDGPAQDPHDAGTHGGRGARSCSHQGPHWGVQRQPVCVSELEKINWLLA